MARLLLGCLALVSAVAAQNKTAAKPNTRLFGNLGGLQGGNFGGVQGGGFGQPGYQGGVGGFPQPGFPGGVGGGFGQPGFPGGVGGFPQPGFPGGVGVNPGFPGGVGVNPGFPGGVGAGIVNPGAGAGGSASCRRWCRTPQGQAYCCESANEPLTAAVTKQGQCPPVRPSCPPTRGFAPPKTCSSDGACSGYDKCCFDTCLQHHTCKPPIGLGRK